MRQPPGLLISRMFHPAPGVPNSTQSAIGCTPDACCSDFSQLLFWVNRGHVLLHLDLEITGWPAPAAWHVSRRTCHRQIPPDIRQGCSRRSHPSGKLRSQRHPNHWDQHLPGIWSPRRTQFIGEPHLSSRECHQPRAVSEGCAKGILVSHGEHIWNPAVLQVRLA